VSGRLPPEVIQRVIRQNFGRFRICYEELLRTNDVAAGRVSLEFVIDGSGAITQIKDSGSDMGDATMVSCITKAFSTITFPRPEGGIVTVRYPLIFNPGE
jgi:acetolactate synthase regulatory subunit